jgi:cell division protein FtsZ
MALANPLIDDLSLSGAKGVLLSIIGGKDMTLFEVDEAASRVRQEVDEDANIIFGSTFDATMQGRMRVSVVATGIAALASQQPAPNYLSLDMNRPVQTGQPALSRPVAPPVGRVAMPAAAMAPAPVIPAAPVAAPMAPPPVTVVPPPPPVMEPAPIAAMAPPAPAPMPAPAMVAEVAPIAAPVMEAPIEAPVAPAPHSGSCACSRRSGSGPCAGAGRCPASAGRRERLARQPSLDGEGPDARRTGRATDGRAVGWGKPGTEPVPADHGRLLGPEARGGACRRTGSSGRTVCCPSGSGKRRSGGSQAARGPSSPGTDLHQPRRYRAYQACAR